MNEATRKDTVEQQHYDVGKELMTREREENGKKKTPDLDKCHGKHN